MTTINVRTKPGRLAFTAPKNGKPIPHDRYVPVALTRYIGRLLAVHGDIEQEPPAPVVKVDPPKPPKPPVAT